MTETYFLKKHADAEIYIKREDLLPFSFGGNKLRIAEKLFEDMRRENGNVMVTYGARTSNLNRVVTAMALKIGTPCRVIMKSGDGNPGEVCENERLVRETGFPVEQCAGPEVYETVLRVLQEEEAAGRKPYYVYGDARGKGHEAVMASAAFACFDEIIAFEKQTGVRFENIFLASGTGSTQAGLTVQAILKGEDEGRRIHGISAARDLDRGKEGVASHIRAFLQDKGRVLITRPQSSCGRESIRDRSEQAIKAALWEQQIIKAAQQERISFYDAYLDENRYGNKMKQTIREMYEGYGLKLDPVYTGRAFTGMLEEIEKKDLRGPVLFIHTGGTPLFRL